jgi:hypothetical protein
MRKNFMPIRFILYLLITIPGLVMADASKGEFMGYLLGSNYQSGANTRKQTTTNGNLIITAESPIKPSNIAEVSLLTTAETLTIGYIDASQWFESEAEAREFGRQYVDLLRAKYPDWEFGRERMDNTLRIVEVNFDQPPYNLRLQLNESKRNGENMWRFSMTLSWIANAKAAQAWRDLSRSQHLTAQEAGRNQLLKSADLRGL